MNVLELLSQRMKDKFKQHIVAGDDSVQVELLVITCHCSVTITKGEIR